MLGGTDDESWALRAVCGGAEHERDALLVFHSLGSMDEHLTGFRDKGANWNLVVKDTRLVGAKDAADVGDAGLLA